MTITPVLPDALTDLASQVTGRVLNPDHADYASIVTPYNVAVVQAPVAAIEVASAADVAAVMRFAAANDYDVAVQATGHGAVARTRPTLMVHTRLLDELDIRPDGTARVGAGVRWAAVIDAAAAVGLAPLCGSSPQVGVVGYLTGGGLSPIGRSYGFGSDFVTAFDVVTGSGEIVRATESSHPDLFWGLRGGKGALGVVTAVEFQLVELAEVYGGCLFFGADDAVAVAERWRVWAQTLPEQASTSLAVLRLPPMPGIPEPLAGKCTLAVRYAWVGDATEGAEWFAPIAEAAPVLLGGTGVMPFAAIGSIHNDPVDPMPIHEESVLLDELTADALEALLAEAGPAADCPQVIVELRLLGGRLADARDSAVSHRDAAFTLLTIGIAVPATIAGTLESAGRIVSAVAEYSSGRCVPNFGASLSPARIARRYDPQTLARLDRIARAYDPAGILPESRAVSAAAALS